LALDRVHDIVGVAEIAAVKRHGLFVVIDHQCSPGPLAGQRQVECMLAELVLHS